MMAARMLFVGLGSSHGDDQIGWVVAQRLAARVGEGVEVRFARSPSELLDWLVSVDELAVCDACLSGASPGAVHCWQWPANEIGNTRFSGSHDLSLTAALSLAEQIGLLPERVLIFGIAVADAVPAASLSPAVAVAVQGITESICDRLGPHYFSRSVSYA